MQGKRGDDKYYCLDDLKTLIGPEVMNFNKAEVDDYIRMVHKKETKDLNA